MARYFEEVFFALGKFFAAFVLAETVAAAAHSGCLNGEDKVVVILPVEERHKALLAGKTLVDEQVFLVVSHGIAEIDSLDSPAVAFKLDVERLNDIEPPPIGLPSYNPVDVGYNTRCIYISDI